MAPMTRTRNAKSQTRLTFTPLSSSPASKHANVRYESPRKASNGPQPRNKRVPNATQEFNAPERPESTLLTPEISSPAEVEGKGNAESPPSERLPNDSTNGDEEEEEEDDDDIVAFGSSRRRNPPDLPSNNANAGQLSQSAKDDQAGMAAPNTGATRDVSTPRRSGRLQIYQNNLSRHSTSSTISVDASSPQKNIRTRQNDLRRSSTTSTISVEILSPNKRQTRSSGAARGQGLVGPDSSPQKSLLSRERALEIGESEISDEEGDKLATRPVQRRRGQDTNYKEVDFVVDDNEIEYDSSSDEDIPVRSIHRSRKRGDTGVIETQSDSESEIVFTTPSKRKRGMHSSQSKKSPRTSRYRNRQDAREIAEDLEDLRDSSPLRSTQTRGRAIISERDRQRKLLDQLKRKRAGKASSSSEHSADGSNVEDDVYELESFDGSDHVSKRIEMLSDSEESSSAASRSVPRQPRHSNEQDLDVDDEDFVVSDPEEDLLGVPTESLPFQFSHHASARPREHFKNVVEWFVKNKMAPAFSRDDEIYNVAFKKVDDEVQGQAGSRYRSAAWNKEFVTVLDARPQFHIQEFDGSEVLHPRCEACNRTNHPATWEVTITGDAYDKNTLEPIDVDNEDAGENEAIEYDMKGNALPPQTRQFHLGRYCAFNAEMTHKLSHWKWHLNDWLLDLLEREGVLSAEAIVARDKLGQRKRETEAENIVDRMEENTEMDRLWRDFKADKERAREGMEDGEGRQSTLLRGKTSGRYGGGVNMFVRS